MTFSQIVLTAFGIGILSLLVLMTVTSFYEKKPKAAYKALILLPIGLLLIGLIFLDAFIPVVVLDIVSASLLIVTCYLLWPAFLMKRDSESIPKDKLDERTVMFSRNELEPGSEQFEAYYKAHPDHKELDDEFRKQPGLVSPKSAFFNPLPYTASEALFQTVDCLQPLVEGTSASKMTTVSSDKAERFIRTWMKKAGAVSVGITGLKDYHWYSVGGRNERYGKKIAGDHPIGIAFTVEMDEEMVRSAPRGSIIMESASRYLEAGVIAVQIAQFIRSMGYNARAHIDGNYQVVCPLVARDAGLGEIGRMGLLMTPELGPRVRIGVITTDMPLNTDKRAFDDSMEDFCEKCMKCAENCPSSAISENPREVINGVKRWQINSEACFTYWCMAGTDCGRCMGVCPYSHPRNFMHNMVRWAIKNFPNFRYWAVRMDDLFYGRKPKMLKVPEWMRINY